MLFLVLLEVSSPNWNDWRATIPQQLLRPELAWEGANLPLESSLRGELGLPANELRDPFIFEVEGQPYMLHTRAGELAIGLARLRTKNRPGD